jgi:hypothetical protein
MQILNTGKLRIVFATFIGGMTVACNAAGTSESDAQALQSRLRNSDKQCTCKPQRSTEQRCDPKLSELEQSSEQDESVQSGQVNDWRAYKRGEKVAVKSADLIEFKRVYGDEMVCTTSSLQSNPRAVASGEQTFRDSSSLAKCSSIARQAVWSQSFANKSENYCIEDKTLTSTDPKAPWYGKSGAALEAVKRRIEAASNIIPFGGKSKGNGYACQCQREEGCILGIRPDPLAKGQSMFMDEYGAFFFENHQQLTDGGWGKCKKHL